VLGQCLVDEHVLLHRLHHQVPLLAHVGHAPEHVGPLLLPALVHHVVDGDESACPAHPCTTMDDHRGGVVVVKLAQPTEEAEEGDATLGCFVVVPGGEVVLQDAAAFWNWVGWRVGG